jgi:predicted enzyme related to lactoylglutathione lyase
MASVTGFGGAFLRASDPEALYRWYEQHLGMVRSGGSFLLPAPTDSGPVVLALFARDDATFPPAQPAMIDLRVDDLDGVLDRLQAAGVPVDPRRDASPFGRFGWFTDPEGNRVELWEPAEG